MYKFPSFHHHKSIITKYQHIFRHNHQCQGQESLYQYIDSGDLTRLERFGDLLVSRSCPSALWKKNKRINSWKQLDVSYVGSSGKTGYIMILRSFSP